MLAPTTIWTAIAVFAGLGLLLAWRVFGDELEVQSRGRLSRLDRGSRSGTDRRGSVRLRESHAFTGQPIDVRSLVNRMAVAREIAPRQIVGQDKHDVRWFCIRA